MDATADIIPATYAEHIAVTHRDGLRSVGLVCGPVTVVGGEPGFDVEGGERTDVDARRIAPGALIVFADGLREVTGLKRRRGYVWATFTFDDGSTLDVAPRQQLTVQSRPHRRSFDERGGMAITRR